jgi:hypothetical protein
VKIKIHFVIQFFANFLKIELYLDRHCAKGFATGEPPDKSHSLLTLATTGIYPWTVV